MLLLKGHCYIRAWNWGPSGSYPRLNIALSPFSLRTSLCMVLGTKCSARFINPIASSTGLASPNTCSQVISSYGSITNINLTLNRILKGDTLSGPVLRRYSKNHFQRSLPIPWILYRFPFYFDVYRQKCISSGYWIDIRIVLPPCKCTSDHSQSRCTVVNWTTGLFTSLGTSSHQSITTNYLASHSLQVTLLSVRHLRWNIDSRHLFKVTVLRILRTSYKKLY